MICSRSLTLIVSHTLIFGLLFSVRFLEVLPTVCLFNHILSGRANAAL